MRRSILAILTGFVFIAVLSMGTGMLLRATFPAEFTSTATSPSLLLLSLVYVAVYAVSGCYLTARLAPDRPMRHAIFLGGLGLAFNLVGTIAMWDTAPAWYHVVALATVLPYAWAGGRLRERELERVARPAARGMPAG